MITEFYDVVLVDFSGLLPFKLEKTEILTRQEEVSQENLEQFLVELERGLKDEFVYIGSDLLETKLFHRAILKTGLLELLIGTPVTLLGHFKEKDHAQKFKNTLQKTLEGIVPKQIAPLLEESIEIRKVKKEIITKKGLRKLGSVLNG
ncbi:MAG: hypothetical protein Q7R70_05535 [Candidatus Diapherotrites archaeon]|nr:hypothetical protein [Candidatus Diapherotrites archaeon]